MFDDQQRKFSGQAPLGRQRPNESSALPAPVLAVRPAAQVQAASSLTAHTLRPVAVQRQTVTPTFQALSLQTVLADVDDLESAVNGCFQQLFG